MDHIESILRINEIDNGIDECEKALLLLPEYIKAIELDIKRINDEIEDKKKDFNRLLLKKKDKEEELKMWEERIEKIRRSADIKSYKNYMAALKEIQNLKAENDRREEEILYHMEEIEKKEKEMRIFISEMTSKAEELKAKASEHRNKITPIQKKLESLKKEREAVEKTIDKKLYYNYLRIRERYKGNVVCTTKNGICSECKMLVPPQMINEVIGGTLHQCPTCSKFLCRVEDYETRRGV